MANAGRNGSHGKLPARPLEGERVLVRVDRHPGEEDDVAAVVTLGGDLAPEQAAAGHDLAQGEVCAVAEAVGRHALLQLESMRMSDYFE